MPTKRARASTSSLSIRKVQKTAKKRHIKHEESSDIEEESTVLRSLTPELEYSNSVKSKPLSFVPTPDVEPFPLERLPTELRIEIFRYHLTIPEMVKPIRVNKNLSSWTKHCKNCPFNQHEIIKWSKNDKRGDAIECKSAWAGKTEIPIPPSVLTLLLTCRSVYEEALPLFYRYNHFALSGGSSTPLFSFLKSIPNRRRYIEEVSVEFDSRKAAEGFRMLGESRLSKLNLKVCMGKVDWPGRYNYFHHPPEALRDGDFRHSLGYEQLSQLRGLKVVNLSGTDRHWVPSTNSMASHVHHVDINSKEAAGPELKKLLMRPRLEDVSEDQKPSHSSPRKSHGRTRTEEDEDSTYRP